MDEKKLIPESMFPKPNKVALVKILPDERVKDFLDGNLYLNTPAHYGEVDRSDVERFDPEDGIDASRHVKEVAIADESGNWVPIGGLINPVTFRTGQSSSVNVLCMYAMNDRAGERFDERNLNFGKVAIYITNLLEFIHRVKTAATESGLDVLHGMVSYVNKETHDGPMGPFRKFSKHSHQNEFRFVFTGGNGSTCRLSVGDLRDITILGPSTEISQRWNALQLKESASHAVIWGQRRNSF